MSRESENQAVILFGIFVAIISISLTYYITSSNYKKKYEKEIEELIDSSIKSDFEYAHDVNMIIQHTDGNINCKALKIKSNKLGCQAYQGEL